MQVCPHCQQEFPNELERCPNDGSTLLPHPVTTQQTINATPRRRQRLRQPIDPRIPTALVGIALLTALIVVEIQHHGETPSAAPVMPINPTRTAKQILPNTMPSKLVPEIQLKPTIRKITRYPSVKRVRQVAPSLPIFIASHPMPPKVRPRVPVTYHLAAVPTTHAPSKDLRLTIITPILPPQASKRDTAAQITQATAPATPAPVTDTRMPTSDAIPFSVGRGISSEFGPRRIVYVLDISASMPSRIDRAKRELGKALQSLRSEESFDIIAFDAQTQRLSDGLLPAKSETLTEANDFLDSLQLGPGTNLEAALTEALAIPGVNDIVVVTDGVPTVGESNFTKLARLIRQRNHVHARIYTVGLVGKNPDGTDDSFEAKQLLDQIARESGGESHIIPLGTTSP